MYCRHCGAKTDDGAKFCPNCGAPSDGQGNVRTIRLKCEACEGTLEVDEGKTVLSCPYCGAKSMIPDSDNVAVAKVKSKAYKEVEFEKMRYKEKKEKERREEEEVARFKKSKLNKFVFVFCVICILISNNAFSHGNRMAGIISGAQALLFALSWLTGMKFIRRKNKNIHILFAVVGFLLAIPFFKYDTIEKEKIFEWPTSGISSELPAPTTNKGYIISDTENSFYVKFEKIEQNDYEEYIRQCIEKGFTIEQEKDSRSFKAYNEEGYKLSISYFSSGKSVSIDVDPPIKMENIRWSSDTLLGKLPAPESLFGKINRESSSGVSLYVGHMSREQYRAYVDQCKEAGFSVDYSRRDDRFSAKNSEGYEVSISYEGFNTILLRINAPEETEAKEYDEASEAVAEEIVEEITTAETVTETTVEVIPENTTSNSGQNGIRPEVKAALDGYEQFIDEYIAFMKKMEKNPSSPMLMLEYASFLTRYTETMEKLDAMGNSDLNDAELEYYLLVTARIYQKLSTVANAA